jgi:DnaK suppressor protein
MWWNPYYLGRFLLDINEVPAMSARKVKTAPKGAAKKAAAKKPVNTNLKKPAAAKPKAPARKASAPAKAGNKKPKAPVKSSPAPKAAGKKPLPPQKPAAKTAAEKNPGSKNRVANPPPEKVIKMSPQKAATATTSKGAAKVVVKSGKQDNDEKEPAAPKIPRRPVAPANATILPPDYDPMKDKGEFMNAVMVEYFRRKLIRWREELLRESSETIHNTLQSTELQKPDLADRASAETDHALELRARDRERKLISKINEALLRIEDGEYGYCEETGEPISVARLDARPIATLSLEAQERHERLEKTHRDD